MDSLLDPLIDQLEPDQVITGSIHVVITMLYFILFLVSLFFVYKIRQGFINAGQWDQGYLGKAFFGSVVGLSILILNFFVTHLWLYLTDGTEILMFNEKGIFAAFGILIFQILFPYASLIIVHVSDSVRTRAKILLWGTVVIVSLGFISTVLAIFSSLPSSAIIALVISGAIMFILLTITAIILIRESRNSFSKINKIRLQILVLGLFFFIIDISLIMIPFILRTSDPQLFVLWLYYIQPIERFITFTITFSAFYLSSFFPLWLQKRTGALPPSFEQLMKKRQSMQWNKIVQRETAEQQ